MNLELCDYRGAQSAEVTGSFPPPSAGQAGGLEPPTPTTPSGSLDWQAACSRQSREWRPGEQSEVGTPLPIEFLLAEAAETPPMG